MFYCNKIILFFAFLCLSNFSNARSESKSAYQVYENIMKRNKVLQNISLSFPIGSIISKERSDEYIFTLPNYYDIIPSYVSLKIGDLGYNDINHIFVMSSKEIGVGLNEILDIIIKNKSMIDIYLKNGRMYPCLINNGNIIKNEIPFILANNKQIPMRLTISEERNLKRTKENDCIIGILRELSANLNLSPEEYISFIEINKMNHVFLIIKKYGGGARGYDCKVNENKKLEIVGLSAIFH